MEKKKFINWIIFFASLGVLAWGLWQWTNPKEATPITSDILLFYGQECPHCKEVEKFIEENQLTSKLKFDQLEVFHNQENGKILSEIAKKCQIENEDEVGVPFLYDSRENRCYIGTPEIEDFFKEKIQTKQ